MEKVAIVLLRVKGCVAMEQRWEDHKCTQEEQERGRDQELGIKRAANMEESYGFFTSVMHCTL